MGENTRVDPDALRRLADRFRATAADVDAAQWPQLPRDALPGAVVSAVVAAATPAGRLASLVADLRDWADSAEQAAAAFTRADTGNGERFSLR